MNEEISGYNPMSLHPDTDAVINTPGFKQHHEALKSITQEAKYKRTGKTIVVLTAQSDSISELFGARKDHPDKEDLPTNQLDDNPAAEDEFTIVQDS